MTTITYNPGSLNYVVGVTLRSEDYEKVLYLQDIAAIRNKLGNTAITPEEFDHLYDKPKIEVETILANLMISYQHKTGHQYIADCNF